MSAHKDPQAISDAVAASISTAIKQRGMSVKAASDASGIPYATLRRKLSGATSFRVSELLQIAEALDVKSPADLISAALGGDRS